MSPCPQTRTAESLRKPLGADNGWKVNFAISEVNVFSRESRGAGESDAADSRTVALTAQAVSSPKTQAQREVAKAIRNGLLHRPSACSACLKVCRPVAHHADYSEPLEVRWLCRKCAAFVELMRGAL